MARDTDGTLRTTSSRPPPASNETGADHVGKSRAPSDPPGRDCVAAALDPTRVYPNLPSAAPMQRPQRVDLALGPPAPISKAAYRLPLYLGIAAAAGVIATASRPYDPTRFGVAALCLLPGLVMQLVLVYRIWQAIRDQYARTSPLKAVLLLLLPVFNLYWLFHVVPGYATDFNRFVERHRIDTPILSQNLILAAIVIPGVGLFIWWSVVGKLCEGVNAVYLALSAADLESE